MMNRRMTLTLLPQQQQHHGDGQGQEEVTQQQFARVSEKFRAAKALLARKRPRLSPRVPLSEISTNIPSPFLQKACYSTTSVFVTQKHHNTHSNRACRSEEPQFNSPLPNKLPPSPSFSTTSSSSAPTPPSNVLLLHEDEDEDEDFDDLVLEQIDALCHQRQSDSSDHIHTSEPEQAVPQFNSSDEAPTSIFPSEPGLSENYSSYLDSLNELQREAASADISTPLMILAGPGSGKTSTMVGRILFLLNKGISPTNILAMTFTTAATSEMRERVGAVAGKDAAKQLLISTFHSFSLQLCRSHADKLERTSEFLVFGQGQQRRAVIEAVRLLENENNRRDLHAHKLVQDSGDTDMTSPVNFKDKSQKWQKFVTQAKASGKTPQDFSNMGKDIGAAILRHYNDILKSCNALDYHDLISCSVRLVTDFPEVLRECQGSWKVIIVDEFQDTSAMQYHLLRILASHNCITIIGDDDQSIFSFNGANISGFDSFREDFPNYKEIRLVKNYRSTRCIVEAASSLIRNNTKRCQYKNFLTDNSSGSKITIKECHNENAQCAFVIDKIQEITSNCSDAKFSYGDIAILYRRQVSGKVFQNAFRDRKIPFNVHGVAFYRKKVVRAIVAMLKTTLPGCDDVPYRQVFKAWLPLDKEEKKRVVNHIDKVSAIRKCSFISAALEVFTAKVSGTFKRSQLSQGRKVLFTLEMISKLVRREQSVSTVITSVANMVPQKYLLEQRAVVDVDGGKLLNEDNDLRSVLQYLLDDVSNFLSTQCTAVEGGDRNIKTEERGCLYVLKSFIDFITERERENFRFRRHDNENSVTLTTIHQSKGLEWDIVFIVKVNDSEIPLLHESNGDVKENKILLEEERRLLYVAMTRARKKLFILYVMMDSSWQMLLPSRFLKEIPVHLLDAQVDLSTNSTAFNEEVAKKAGHLVMDIPKETAQSDVRTLHDEGNGHEIHSDEAFEDSTILMKSFNGNNFLRRFCVEDRSVISHIFHQWAKKPAFKDPKRLIGKVGFVIDERLRVKKNKHKDVLRSLKSCLNSEEAFQYAEHVLRWEQIPPDQRAHLMREKQEHFQKLRIEKSMDSSAPTSKQISYLQNLGCTVTPTSRLHASKLIEQYKSL